MAEVNPTSAAKSGRYKGVRKRKWGKWVSEIRLPSSRGRIWLGSFDSEEKAAKAFDAALYCLRGSSASFNFPENLPDIPDAHLLTTSQIQAAAADFAKSMTNEQEVEELPGSPTKNDEPNDINREELPSKSEPSVWELCSSDVSDMWNFPGFNDMSTDLFHTWNHVDCSDANEETWSYGCQQNHANYYSHKEAMWDRESQRNSFLWNFGPAPSDLQ